MNLWGVIKGLLVQEESDRTKQLSLEVDSTATTATRTTVKSAQSVDRTLNLPDADDTLIGKNTTDTLTNKSIDADTNTITNIENADIKAAAAIDVTKLSTGVVDNTEFDNLNGVGSQVVGESDTNTLTNKTIDADSNTISNIDDNEIKALAGIDATKIADGSVDNTEFQRLNGLTGDIQSQLDAKIDDYGAGVDNAILKSNATGDAVERSGVLIDDSDNVTIPGDLTVNGTTTTLNTATLDVEDANITVNKNGNQAGANSAVSGITVEMSDATDARMGYDSSLTSKFKIGEVGSEVEVADVSSAQTLTNKTIDADNNTISNLAHGAEVDNPSSGVHGVTGNVVGTSDTQDLSNKTFTDAVTLEEQASTPSTPAAGDKKLYPKTDGKLYTLNSAGEEIEVGSGSGQGSINYIQNPDAEVNLDNVNVTANITKTAETVAPLRGDQSYNFSISSSATTADNIDFLMDDVDPADLSKNLYISFDIRTDANYSTDDLQVVLRNVDSSVDIQVTGGNGAGKIAATGSSIKRFTARVPVDNIDNTYTLRFNVLSAPASNSEVVIDNVQIGPDKIIDSPVMTDWQSFNPTGTWTTNTTYTGFYRRSNDRMIGTVLVSTSGAPNATTLQLDIPFGLTLDTSKAVISGDQQGNYGRSRAFQAGVAFYNLGAVSQGSSVTQLRCWSATGTQGVQGFISNTSPFTFGASDNVVIEFDIPISEWANSSAVLSTSELLNENQFGYVNIESATNHTATGTSQVVPFNTVKEDDFGLWDNINYRFIFNEVGRYQVTAAVRFVSAPGGSNANIFHRDSGGTNIEIYDLGMNSDVSGTGSCIINVTAAGQYVDVEAFQNTGGNLGYQAAGNGCFFQIIKLPDLSVYGIYNEPLKTQTKFLTSNTANGFNGTLTDMTFNNLTIGKWYSVQGQIDFRLNGSAQDNIDTKVLNGGTTLMQPTIYMNVPSSTGVTRQNFYVEFQATNSTVSFLTGSVGANAFIVGDGTTVTTWATLSEINPKIETSEF